MNASAGCPRSDRKASPNTNPTSLSLATSSLNTGECVLRPPSVVGEEGAALRRPVVRQEPARRTLARTALAAWGSLADPGGGRRGPVGDRRTALARQDGGVDPRSGKRTRARPLRLARRIPQLGFERPPGGVRTDGVLAGRSRTFPSALRSKNGTAHLRRACTGSSCTRRAGAISEKSASPGRTGVPVD